MNLEEENKILKQKLDHAQKWMQEEVFGKKTSQDFKVTIKEQILGYFPPESLSNFPDSTLEYLVSAETIFHHLIEGEQIDGTTIVLEYQKALDAMLELYITGEYRKYAIGLNPSMSSPLEKSLSLMVHKNYIFSLGRLYEVLKNMQEDTVPGEYENTFRDFLKSRSSLHKALLETDFFLQLQELVDLGIFTEKRHSGIISLSDTVRARKLITGGYQDQNSLLYSLASTQIV